MVAICPLGKSALAESGVMPDNFDREYWGDRIDISRWKGGNGECARGIQYREHGITIDGAPGAKRTLGGSRKARGSASADLERKEKQARLL